MPCASQDCETHRVGPQTWGPPEPPHVGRFVQPASGASPGHMPHSSVPPQPSPAEPHS